MPIGSSAQPEPWDLTNELWWQNNVTLELHGRVSMTPLDLGKQFGWSAMRCHAYVICRPPTNCRNGFNPHVTFVSIFLTLDAMFLIVPPRNEILPAQQGHEAAAVAAGNEDQPEEIRSRVRKACNRCRLRKVKCNGRIPCTRCERDHATCKIDNMVGLKNLSRRYSKTAPSKTAVTNACAATSRRLNNNKSPF